MSKTSAGRAGEWRGKQRECCDLRLGAVFVAFRSLATNLPGNKIPNVYLHDRKSGRTVLVSKTSAGTLGRGWLCHESGDFPIGPVCRF